eukprot:CAMPEP_0171256218 /NCGR_PEP_ID=MMETSP0790-20130122/53185_1 /TAXON_ID=2925 /ORGANISM="Alexandrium catenella, Strain OF101" /LENGTH=67 /DNA_ID=CAMNT_0011724227 /DNA_START=52 /DNA_END=255 /DNA_ORIENTATION=-
MRVGGPLREACLSPLFFSSPSQSSLSGISADAELLLEADDAEEAVPGPSQSSLSADAVLLLEADDAE